jgi:hypothetical protein
VLFAAEFSNIGLRLQAMGGNKEKKTGQRIDADIPSVKGPYFAAFFSENSVSL